MTRHPQRDLYESTLVEIGRITTTWAKFEHWIDVAIWYLADVEDRRGACITIDGLRHPIGMSERPRPLEAGLILGSGPIKMLAA